jgi:hypothetical protein
MMSVLTLLLLPFLVVDEPQPKTPYSCLAADMEAYITVIKQSVLASWRPSRGEEAKKCVVVLAQSFRGEVLNVEFEECAHEAPIRKTIEDAVYLSSPLPLPVNTHCFERTLKISLYRPR